MLRRTLVVAVVVLAVIAVSESAIPPAGRCINSTNVTPALIDFNYLISFPIWRVIYLPVDPVFDSISSDTRYVLFTSNLQCKVNNSITLADNSTPTYTFTLTYRADGTLYEDAVDEATGETQQFKWIPIIVTNDLAAMYIRCSDTGSLLNAVTIFIVIPLGKQLSLVGEQQLMVAINMLQLSGGIRKLSTGVTNGYLPPTSKPIPSLNRLIG